MVASFFFNISYSLKTCWTVIYLNRDKPTKMHFKQSLKSQFQEASDRTTEGFIWASNISNSTWEPSSHCPNRLRKTSKMLLSTTVSEKGVPLLLSGMFGKELCLQWESFYY